MRRVSMPPLFLQLHSLRRESAVDAEGTLRLVKPLGFDGAEIAGDYGWSRERWRTLLAETGLSVVAAHVSLEDLEEHRAERLAFYRALGVGRLVVTALPRAPQTAERYHGGARRLNAAGRILAAEGFSLAYHHHDYEFQWADEARGVCGLDVLLAETDPDGVGFEFDTFWLENTGRNAVDFIRRQASRARLIHAKDWRAKDEKNVIAGEGSVDFATLLPMCAAHGWPVVLEYEGAEALAGVRKGAKYLRGLPGRSG